MVSRALERVASRGSLTISARPPAGIGHLIVIAALGVVAVLIAWPAFGFPPSIPPFGPDNVFALELSTQSDPTVFFSSAEQVWRPVTYSTLWAQYQVSGLDISAFFSVNIVLWILCAALVYVLVYTHTQLVLAAAAAAFFTLTDERMFPPLILIIERQSLLACIFGLLALLAAHRCLRDARHDRGLLAAIFVLLLLAGMSKEFGLAFAFGVAAIGLLNRRREVLAVAFGAFIAYWAFRGLAGGLNFGSGVSATDGLKEASTDTGLCETMGFGANPHDVCYGNLTALEQLAQFTWNVGASFVGIFFPPVISADGYLVAPDFLASTLGGPDDYNGFAVASLIVPLVVTGLAVVAWLKRPAAALPLLAVIVANAALCFQYYRPRLVIVGMVALHIAAGIGIAPTLDILKRQWRRLGARIERPAMTGTTVLVAILVLATGAAVVSRAVGLADDLEGGRGSHAVRDPCDAIEVYDVTEMPNRLREKFDLPGKCDP
jgi:hypothetical protein